MLSDFFAARWRIRALRDGPAGAVFEGFAQALSDMRYAVITGRRRCRYAHANRIDVLNGARIFLMYLRDAYLIPAAALNDAVQIRCSYPSSQTGCVSSVAPVRQRSRITAGRSSTCE